MEIWLGGKKGRAIAKYRPYPTEKALKLYKKRGKGGKHGTRPTSYGEDRP